MFYKEKIHTLKNNSTCILRSPVPADAAAILNEMRLTSDETDFLSRSGDEITMSVPMEQEFLENAIKSPSDLMICAIVDGKIVATAGLTPVLIRERCRHRADFGISVLKEYWGLGIGSLLLSAIISGAREMNYEQIELEVVCENEKGIALYKKFGFQIYGTLTHAFKYRDGTYASEYLMLLEL